MSRRQAKGPPRNSPVDSCHEPRQPAVGCARNHGELLKLGIDIGQTSVAKYMARRRRPPSQGWKTFIRNHADGIASMDLFVVPTFSFQLLYGLLILSHGRRQILWLGVTAHPSAEWMARQFTEACGWEWSDPGAKLNEKAARPLPPCRMGFVCPPLSIAPLDRTSGGRGMKNERAKTATLRHLHAQIDRAQSRSRLQLARCSARSLRGLYQEPGARGLDACPREVR